MTTDEKEAGAELERLNENISRMEELSQRLVAAMANKRQVDPSLQGPSQDVFRKAATAYWTEWMNNPAKLIEHQAGYWGKMLQHYVDVQRTLSSGKLIAPPDDTPGDKRFANPLWSTHPFFNFIKQNYMRTTQAIDDAVAALEDLDDRDRQKVSYFTHQIMDMFAPTNFLATNPDALERAVATQGQSLVDGLENLVRDIESHDGDLIVTLSDPKAFQVGENLATTPGKVVFRNRMFELIQYTPTTETVHTTPLLIFPPWINKFYILDLKEKNSLIKWIVDQGFTLFVVSWVNPDESYADVSMDDYVQDGYLTAIEQVKQLTGEKQINAVGYCIAGTTLSLTLALMAKRGDTSIKSATFFTTLTDFSDPGEVGVFLDDSFVDGIERECAQTGILDSFFMSRTFSFLRSNDLIYGPAVKSYMMGEAPPAFDLLHWNGDGTNLPGKMAVQYLRGLCQSDRFATTGFTICGETVTSADVKTTLCAIACETDHIAPWKPSYRGIQKFGSRSKTFILSESGHIAGIVNPPSKKKYGHYTNTDLKLSPDDWRAGAEFHEGSWWPRWGEWLAKKSGKQVPARMPGDAEHPALTDAPGTYVVARKKAS
ncbi:class I poly(R)-hydroxyalkanoic acid synthase [Meridianimarinicoccus roseus]|jgi:polyhydroxyalkanoate synthase|uniref:Class I poly(R)-hydroxyalkanoic acid synthase n=1 Tax=Meridianimarinicoccus roseus TaxID=2072018 RepID=A0A2V2LFJ1_9RHOB|nr:class I poly(R)-hydroxyalkanoic acid synthase [Meridianimarinicoccus roseus]PWR04205.1 class I poly(R)-hydroxyalkanoic acid synthase [Meridianimarinicoccus roseus]